MLALGRIHRWPPAYWHGMSWHDFGLYVWQRNVEIEADLARSREDDGTRIPIVPLSPPGARELAEIPWSGFGPDPLEDVLQ